MEQVIEQSLSSESKQLQIPKRFWKVSDLKNLFAASTANWIFTHYSHYFLKDHNDFIYCHYAEYCNTVAFIFSQILVFTYLFKNLNNKKWEGFLTTFLNGILIYATVISTQNIYSSATDLIEKSEDERCEAGIIPLINARPWLPAKTLLNKIDKQAIVIDSINKQNLLLNTIKDSLSSHSNSKLLETRVDTVFKLIEKEKIIHYIDSSSHTIIKDTSHITINNYDTLIENSFYYEIPSEINKKYQKIRLNSYYINQLRDTIKIDLSNYTNKEYFTIYMKLINDTKTNINLERISYENPIAFYTDPRLILNKEKNINPGKNVNLILKTHILLSELSNAIKNKLPNNTQKKRRIVNLSFKGINSSYIITLLITK